jgi:hypothetical protein
VVALEPDPVGVDDGDDGDRHPDELGGELGDPVEGTVGRGVEDVVAPYREHPVRLVRRDDVRCGRHSESFDVV